MSFHISCIRSRFARDNKGNVAIVFGLALLPMLMAVGSAVDYSMATNVRTHLQAATDAAAIQLCQAPTTATVSQLKEQAEAYMSPFLASFNASVDTPTILTSPRRVRLTTHATYDTAVMVIAGYDQVSLAASATCFPASHVEVALALDTTGSMNDSGGGTTKIAGLRSAATGFVNYMFNDPLLGSHTKVSIVPFAASVAVNPTTSATATWVDTTLKSPYHWQNVQSASGSGFTNRLAVFNKLKTVKKRVGLERLLRVAALSLECADQHANRGQSGELLPADVRP